MHTVPALIGLYQTCRAYHTLPRAGGILDQPAGLLDKMTYLVNLAQAIIAYEKEGTQPGAQAAWANKHPDAYRLAKWSREFTKQFGGENKK